jgi:hypothetical protein
VSNTTDIVVVNASVASGGAQAAGFGIPLILGSSTGNAVLGADVIRFYTGLDGMVSDGFAVTDAEYLAAEKMFSQEPAPATIAVGKRSNPPTKTVTITPTAANSTAYAMTVQNQAVSVTSDSSATAAEICDALKTAIDALALSGITTVSATGVLTVSGSAGKWFQISVANRARLALKETSSDAGVATDLAAIQVVNDSWYAAMSVFSSAAEITAMSTWMAAAKKLYVQQTSDTGCVTLRHHGHHVHAARRERRADRAHVQQRQRGLQGRGLARGVPAHQARLGELVEPHAAAVHGGRAHRDRADEPPQQEGQLLRERSRARTMTAGGTCADGGFIDVVRGKDWMASRIATDFINLLNSLANQGKKLPYDDQGITAVGGLLNAINQEATSNGFLDPKRAPKITLPSIANISQQDRTDRVLNGVTDVVYLSNAINKCVFQLNLSF